MPKKIEEARQLSSKRNIPDKARISNFNPKAEEVKQAPGMITAPSYDGLHIVRESNSLDEFAP